MIEFIFTIDYEIYGNGEGSLREHIYEPAERLAEVFRKWEMQFVSFVEVAELEMIEAKNTNQTINSIKQQLRLFYKEGFELGLHIHPQWYNATYENQKWIMDYNEYNLCVLPYERIDQIVRRAILYLRDVLDEPDFTPISFRAGNWLFQPTQAAARVLATNGIKVDSSVFKGGLQHKHKMDYRKALKNGNYWTFTDDASFFEAKGILLELPIFTKMVPFWKMLSTKRITMEKLRVSGNQNRWGKLDRLPDFLRIRYPLKLDFCRMNIRELIFMMDEIICEDQKDPTSLRPIVAIGHTKELVDIETVESFLRYLEEMKINVTTLNSLYKRHFQ